MAVTLLLRLYKLDSGLWLDEILTYLRYARLSFGTLITTYDSENQHFLFSLLAHASFVLFGESAWSLRLPAVLFGVASVGALYLLGLEVGRAREALLAAALMSLSYHHVWFSQNARGYTGLLFWTILSSWLFVRSRNSTRARDWLLFALAAALGVYTHITMVFVIAGQFAAHLWGFRGREEDRSHRWFGLFFGFGAAGLLAFQLHAIVLPQILGSIEATVSVVEAWKQPAWTLLELLQGLQLSFASGLFVVAALILFGAGLLSYARSSPVVVQLLLIPPIIGSALVIGVGHHLWPRFFFFTFGFGALVVIRGAMELGRLTGRLFSHDEQPGRLLGTALCLGMVAVSASSVPSAFGPKQDYEGALQFVEKAKVQGDAVVTVGLAIYPYREFYDVEWRAVETVEELEEVSSNANRTWVVSTLEPVLESVSPEILDSLRRDFVVVEGFPGTLRGGTVFVYRSQTSSANEWRRSGAQAGYSSAW